ncbi:hypothetical protein ACPCIY_04770 [Streptomyces thermodiastaticus]
MADEQYRWLDRDTAERLLRGEPPGTADTAVTARAERLARALDSLTAGLCPEPPADEELPGEAAALAAFRKARAEAADAARSAGTAEAGLGGACPPGVPGCRRPTRACSGWADDRARGRTSGAAGRGTRSGAARCGWHCPPRWPRARSARRR